ncbi:phospholipase, patatin family [Hyphomonas neptunium ATCC 15444]|uniref:Phospholipase, patatin family n=2 Tax=Hyphomonas TaxID=85 RepID=Q0C4R9_HYPNA|nr:MULTISPECIES: patatin-like phospholipase family protein [Hyphomonas]ABI76839.1 phospholipase, patatin family [Hyphomonas neptunium ATCC 15444]KCZ96514.1 patatin family phospholipase [Hyphomonas hirschiana VP5]
MTQTISRTPALRLTMQALAVLSLLTFAAIASAQDAPESQPGRPKVALVLSGGGALGLSHVGAIQELEAMGIRPDIVVGTSMGAVIGGLYASGLSSAELEEVVNSANWSGVFNPAPQRDKLTFRQKQQQVDFPGTASLGVSGAGLLLPTGAISDQALMKELRRVTPARMEVDNFDDLTIPFRAVATDIATGEAVVISAGELPMAMRASMSVPGVFPAFDLDGKLLVDGGLAANIPVSVAREMGADIVIALWTPNELLQQEQIGSVVDVLSQTVSLLILANERAEIASMLPQDVLVRVNTGSISPAAFTRSKELIEAGRASIRAEAEKFAPIAQGREPVSYAGIGDAPAPVISFVRIENASRLNQSLLEERMSSVLGKPADTSEINEALDRIYALGPFERVDYTMTEQDGLTGLIVRAEDSRRNVGRLRLGMIVENDFNTESDVAVSLDYRSPALDAYGSELRAIATIGDINEFGVEYFRLLEPEQSWFAVARAEVENRPVNIYTNRGFKTAGYDLTYGLLGIDAGRQFGNIAEVRVGTELGTGRAKLNEGAAPVEEVDIDSGRIFASAGLDTLDNPFFPQTGLTAKARWTHGLESLGDNADYQTLSASGLHAFTMGRNTLLTSVSGGVRLSGAPPLDTLYRIGGLFSLSGYRLDELAGENFVAGRLIYRRSLTNTEGSLFGIPLFVGGSLEAGEVWSNPDEFSLDDMRFGGSVYVGANTALGPVYLAFGRSEGGRQSAYLVIGRSF